MARQVFEEFKTDQRSPPVVNLVAFIRLPAPMLRPFCSKQGPVFAGIRVSISTLTQKRAD